MLATKLKTLYNVLILLEIYSKIASRNSKNFSLLAKKSIFFNLLLSIILTKSSNLLLKLSNKDSKLKKRNLMATVTLCDLKKLNYIIDQSLGIKSQGFSTINKVYINYTKNF